MRRSLPDMECWLHDSNINLYSFGGMLLDMGYNLFSEKKRWPRLWRMMAADAQLKNSHVRQLNQDIRKPLEDEIIMYLSFRYKCDMAGTLKVGFDGNGSRRELVLQEFKNKPNNEYQIFEITGEWDGRGDFGFTVLRRHLHRHPQFLDESPGGLKRGELIVCPDG